MDGGVRMNVLVHVIGNLDDTDLWPLVTGPFRQVEGGALLTLDVHDSRELVGALAELSRCGIEIVKVDILGSDATNDAP